MLPLLEVFGNIIKGALNNIPVNTIDKRDVSRIEQPPKFDFSTTVNIGVDRKIREKYKSGWIKNIRNKPVTELVVHGTAGTSTIDGLLTWMYQGERAKNYYKGIGLFHYLIGRNEKPNIIEVISPEYYVLHSTSGSKHEKGTIGVELINPSKTNRDPYTDAQYVSLVDLFDKILYPVFPQINRIVGHIYNIMKFSREEPKACPGNGFDWERLQRDLKNRGYSFQYEKYCIYDIKKG